jgi:hypothetical protein
LANTLAHRVEWKTEVIFENQKGEFDRSLMDNMAKNAGWAVEKLIENKSEKKVRRFIFLSILVLN